MPNRVRVRRLYSTFASGWPGTGLLLMRLVVGSILLARTVPTVFGHQPLETLAAATLLAGCAILLVFGIWTPISGAFVAATELYRIAAFHSDVLVSVLLATIACALAMLGPGLWSVDARLFGWKRVEVPIRRPNPASD